MRKITLLLTMIALGLLLTMGCGGENNIVSSSGDQFSVRYEVRFLSEGAVKISHKDSAGRMITEDPATANWERAYSFGSRVNALLDVEASEAAPVNSVTIQLAIYINGSRAQQVISTIAFDKKSSLGLTRP